MFHWGEELGGHWGGPTCVTKFKSKNINGIVSYSTFRFFETLSMANDDLSDMYVITV